MNTAATPAMLKLKMLKGSMRCFVFGLLSFIPLLGFPFAIAALWISGRVRTKEKLYWNAGRPYRIIGMICAALTSVLWFFIISLIVYHATMGSSYNG